MAVIHVYFDESGKKGDHPVVTFSGVGASENQLHKFSDAWRELLDEHELPYLHMAHALRTSRKLSDKIPKQQVSERIAVLKRFADCVNAHLEVGLIQALDVNGFNAMSKEARARLGNANDPYYIAFTRALIELAHFGLPEDQISLICDDDAETAWTCYQHYRAVRRVHNLVRKKTVGLCFADDKHFPALQAADMVAVLARLEARRLFYGVQYSYVELLRYLVSGQMLWKVLLADESQMRALSNDLSKP